MVLSLASLSNGYEKLCRKFTRWEFRSEKIAFEEDTNKDYFQLLLPTEILPRVGSPIEEGYKFAWEDLSVASQSRLDRLGGYHPLEVKWHVEDEPAKQGRNLPLHDCQPYDECFAEIRLRFRGRPPDPDKITIRADNQELKVKEIIEKDSTILSSYEEIRRIDKERSKEYFKRFHRRYLPIDYCFSGELHFYTTIFTPLQSPLPVVSDIYLEYASPNPDMLLQGLEPFKSLSSDYVVADTEWYNFNNILDGYWTSYIHFKHYHAPPHYHSDYYCRIRLLAKDMLFAKPAENDIMVHVGEKIVIPDYYKYSVPYRLREDDGSTFDHCLVDISSNRKELWISFYLPLAE